MYTVTIMSHYILYVPGILDDVAHVQSTLVKLWRVHGVRGGTHVMPWRGQQDYEKSLKSLLSRIDRIRARGHQVSLVGASAGATAVLNAYFERLGKIETVILICPKIHNRDNISTKLVKRNPSFMDSLRLLEKQLPNLSMTDKSAIFSFVSPSDGLVPYADSAIEGVEESTLPPLRHNAAILYALSFGFVEILPKLKRNAETA